MIFGDFSDIDISNIDIGEVILGISVLILGSVIKFINYAWAF